MPIYEYECHGCRRRVSLLVLSPSTAAPPVCPRCGSAELSRLMSRFATVKSEDARLDSLADPSQYGDLDENDPRSVARFMKRMGQEMGEDMGEDVAGCGTTPQAAQTGPDARRRGRRTRRTLSEERPAPYLRRWACFSGLLAGHEGRVSLRLRRAGRCPLERPRRGLLAPLGIPQLAVADGLGPRLPRWPGARAPRRLRGQRRPGRPPAALRRGRGPAHALRRRRGCLRLPGSDRAGRARGGDLGGAPGAPGGGRGRVGPARDQGGLADARAAARAGAAPRDRGPDHAGGALPGPGAAADLGCLPRAAVGQGPPRAAAEDAPARGRAARDQDPQPGWPRWVG
ncbi:MAG: zinc ribbon domain-containing protein [Candidatus Rokubacteria bacterium]|nr:zinc ribbon domain-containing protein [Candidatus Rokubacteria bacterium]